MRDVEHHGASAARRLPNPEALEPLRFFVAHVDALDLGPGWPRAAELDERCHGGVLALQDRLDRPVVAVGHPPADAAALGPFPYRVAKEHALDAASDHDMPADDHRRMLPACNRSCTPSAPRAMLAVMSALWLLIGLMLGAGAAAAILLPRARAPAEAAAGAERLLAPVQEQLSRVDAQLRALDRDRHALGGRLETQLTLLLRANEALRTETGALAGALRRPNVRGQWGQVQLRRVVELAGMVEHCDFAQQVTLPSGLRPDLIVTLPGGTRVVVDAKAPLDAMLDAGATSDEATRRRQLVAHARALRAHVQGLAAKAYAAELPGGPELVVLFLPGEHLYGLALEADPALLEDAMSRRVLIATPTTLLAILRAIAQGWQQQQVAESAQVIAELGRELHRRLARLSGLLASLGGRLTATVRAYNETVASYDARVVPAARRLAEHGAGAAAPVSGPEVLAAVARAPAGADHEPPPLYVLPD